MKCRVFLSTRNQLCLLLDLALSAGSKQIDNYQALVTDTHLYAVFLYDNKMNNIIKKDFFNKHYKNSGKHTESVCYCGNGHGAL